jgi:hypothetical protein
MSARSSKLPRAASIAAAVLAFAASSLGAQGGAGGFAGARGSGGTVTAREHPTIPVQTVRALVATHHADIANGTSDNNILTLMIDSNGNYIGSAASKANIIVARTAAPNGDAAAAVSSGGARGAGGGGGFISAAPTGAVASTTPGGVIATSSEPGKMTFVGIGTVDATLVQDMFFMSYEAGEVAPNALRVRFVILKNGVPK